MQELHNEAIGLLKKLISVSRVSKDETAAADLVQNFLESKGHKTTRKGNNVWVVSDNYSSVKPTILLNSHIDTVKPSSSWTLPPNEPLEKEGKLYGLGSNDSGASLVSLISAFLHLSKKGNLPYNLVIAATAEEENSGAGGIISIVEELGKVDLAIFGEPTKMQMAVAEKGLMVLDCVVHGKAGHAARDEGENAIYKALKDIEWFRTFQFPEESKILGNVKMSITQINAGYQHNIVPDKCAYVVDIRTNEYYRNLDVLEIVKNNMICTEVTARSTRLNSSAISLDHPIVGRGIENGLCYYGSPTTSDQAVVNYTSIKIGPGDSVRSHAADEYVYLKEIEQGIDLYIKLLDGLKIKE